MDMEALADNRGQRWTGLLDSIIQCYYKVRCMKLTDMHITKIMNRVCSTPGYGRA